MSGFKDFCQELNESSWMGSVCEVGLGVPFQSMFLANPGASKTIMFSHSPYSKTFQPAGVRSVSADMVRKLAKADFFREPYALVDFPGTKRFALAVSASHKNEGERGETHGWICICTNGVAFPSHENLRYYLLHFRMNKTYVVGKDTRAVSRTFAGALYAYLIRWFASKILLNKWETWGEAIENMPPMNVDIIEAPDISIEEHLLLAKENNPLLFHEGKFQRTSDYLRKYNQVYRGSFNPPTLAHTILGENALFEMEVSNARKGKVSLSDIAHRVRMVNLTGKPLLVNCGYPLFADLHRMLQELGCGNLNYLVGVDTFNDIANPEYIPYEDFLSPFYAGGTGKFLVIPREGYEVGRNEYSDKLEFEMVDTECPTISSTAVRAGDYSFVDEKIIQYITDNNLYKE